MLQSPQAATVSQKMGRTILLVDFENVQKIDLSIIPKKDIEIKIFVGQSQNKISFDLVQATQCFGNAIEWIKVEGIGSNSLDFYIAFYLGRLSKDNPKTSFIILSKDKGFDPLINYICKQKIACQRIQSLLELANEKEQIFQDEELIVKVLENLSKIDKNKRPRTRRTLRQHIKTLLAQKKLSEQQLDTLVDSLIDRKKVTEVSDRIAYNF